MYLRRKPCWWPRRRIEVIQRALPDSACPGLLQKPSGDYLFRIAPAAARASNNKMTMQNVPALLAILMAIAMRRCNTKCIAWWRRFMAFIKAAKCCHQASTHSNSIKADTTTTVVSYVSSSLWKRAWVDMLAPNNNKGMAYQTDENHLSNLVKCFVGVVNSLTAIDAHERQLFNKLHWWLVTLLLFVRC